MGKKVSSAACWSIRQRSGQEMDGGVSVYQVPSVFQVVLADALSRQLCQHVVQVVGVRVAVAGQVGAKFCLVVNLVPYHRVRLACGAGCADGEDEASVPSHDQQLEDLERPRRVEETQCAAQYKVTVTGRLRSKEMVIIHLCLPLHTLS